MNSEDNKPNAVTQEEACGSHADGNANVNLGIDQSKGAIPKTRPIKTSNNASKKPVKLNNNVEEMRNLNGKNHDAAKLNGYTNGTNFLESYLFNDTNCATPESDNYLQEFDLKLNYEPHNAARNRISLDSDSSSDDTELLSVSDDGCIYTYKGDNVADLPDSFFSLDIPPIENARENSSPEMDFLEMDFDPGAAGDVDSDSGDVDIEQEVSVCKETVAIVEEVRERRVVEDREIASSNSNKLGGLRCCLSPKPELSVCNKESPQQQVRENNNLSNAKMPWACTISERTTCATVPRYIKRHQSSNGDLQSAPVTPENSEPKTNFPKTTTNAKIKKVMIWTEDEANSKQVNQIGASACGATAVLNVLKALRYPIPSKEKLQEAITTRLRANSSPLTDYLLSRSVAGTTHEDLISALHKISSGDIYARFFPMCPERVLNLHKWLTFWIENGAIPIATLNLQRNLIPIPDAWHHQMIFGAGPEGVYLTNPVECVESEQLWPQLSSESVLLVRREDVLLRWNPMELRKLMNIRDVRWRRLNVVGQVANVVRESLEVRRFTNTSHIRIPAAYRAGVTLAVEAKSTAFALLSQCPELPLLNCLDLAAALPNTVV